MGLQVTHSRIYFTLSSEKFAPFGIPRPLVPLFHDERMRLLETPTLWMIALSVRGKTESPKTWESYAYGLLDFLRCCEANGWDYLEIGEGYLAAYRDHLKQRKTSRKTRMGRRSISHRLTVVTLFYRWLLSKGLILALPFTDEERRVRLNESDVLSFARRGRRASSDSIRPRAPKQRIPVALKAQSIQAICSDLSERDDLIASWSLSTGAREDEILALELTQIPDVQHERFSASKIIEVPIWKTKRLKPRTLHVPREIMDRTWRYIIGERAKTIKILAKRGKKISADAKTAVFVSEKGNRLAARTLQGHFRTAADKNGSSATFHDLRHNFAIHRLIQLRKHDGGDKVIEPLRTLKTILGHEDIATVMIYLQAIEDDPHIAEDALQAWVASWSTP